MGSDGKQAAKNHVNADERGSFATYCRREKTIVCHDSSLGKTQPKVIENSWT